MRTNERLSCIESTLICIKRQLSDISYEISSLKDLLVKYEGSYKDKKRYELRNILVNECGGLKKDTYEKLISLFEEVLKDKEIIEKELQKLKEEAEF